MINTTNIALFASGSGTNVENICKYFKDNSQINIACILCNNPKAYVIKRAELLNVDFWVFSRENFNDKYLFLSFLKKKNVDFIILAGFLWLVPQFLIDEYPNKIINIHPALLPKYGGKGMYGDAVHNAVFNNKEVETGITVHYVNSNYDEGQIIFQKKVNIENDETPSSIAEKVHKLEYDYYPKVIEKILLKLKK